MNLNCYICNEKFTDITHGFKHLKVVHFVKENADEKLFCLATNCTKTYYTFDSLRAHIKKCVNNKLKDAHHETVIFAIIIQSFIHCRELLMFIYCHLSQFPAIFSERF